MSPRALLPLVVLALVAGCNGDDADGPRWVHLAEGFRPVTFDPIELDPAAFPAARVRVSAGDVPGTLWAELDVPDARWSATPIAGAWRAPRPLPSFGRAREGSPPQRLTVAGEPCEYVSAGLALSDLENLGDDAFCAVGPWIYAVVPDGPPTDAVFGERIERGHADAGRWQVEIGSLAAEGFLVVPGTNEEFVLDVPPGSALRFRTAIAGWSDTPEGVAGNARVDVSVDGAQVYERELESGSRTRSANHSLLLPPNGGEGTRVRFSVSGAASLVAIVAPTVGPADIGEPGARPWGGARPDLVVVLLDTYRADNLATYGGDPRVSPNLDRFAENALLFERAWSSGSWTLPSHASMFAGLHPHEAGVTASDDALPGAAVTIAERLREIGYRTAAVTDRGYVSRVFGLAQGFETFDEYEGTTNDTVARVRGVLDADDGRPLFVFVQSYRAHTPYRASAEAASALDVDADWEQLDSAKPASVARDAVLDDEGRRWLASLERLYRAASFDLDRCFGRLEAELDGRGYGATAITVVTSDHGEAFREHDALGHSTGVWEENVRIPLLIRGPGIEPGRTRATASLVDLAPTLAALAGLTPDPTWSGRDLLAHDDEALAFAFQCSPNRGPSSAAWIEGDLKLVTRAPGELEPLGCYDLGADPLERTNLFDSDAARAHALLERVGPAYAPLLDARLPRGSAAMDAEVKQRLRALGYLGR